MGRSTPLGPGSQASRSQTGHIFCNPLGCGVLTGTLCYWGKSAPPIYPYSAFSLYSEPQLHRMTWNRGLHPKNRGVWIKVDNKKLTHFNPLRLFSRSCNPETPCQAKGRATDLKLHLEMMGGVVWEEESGPDPIPRHVPRRDTWRRICSESTWRRGGGLRGGYRWDSKDAGLGGRGRGGGGCGGRGDRRLRPGKGGRRLRSTGERHDGRGG